MIEEGFFQDLGFFFGEPEGLEETTFLLRSQQIPELRLLDERTLGVGHLHSRVPAYGLLVLPFPADVDVVGRFAFEDGFELRFEGLGGGVRACSLT